MEINFEKDYLRELFYNGVTKDKKYRFQPDIVKTICASGQHSRLR